MNFDQLHVAGVEAYIRADYQEAERLLRQALSIDPNSAPVHSNLGITLHALGQHLPALLLFNRAIELNPYYPEAWSNRAMPLAQLRRWDEAVYSCDKAIGLRPDYGDAFCNRADTLLQLDRFEEALATAERAIELKPDFVPPLVGSGTALNHLRRFTEALAKFERALALDPRSAAAMVGMGMTLQLLGGHERAVIDWYDRALAIKPDWPEVRSNKIFALDFVPDATTWEQQQARKDWWRYVGVPIAQAVGVVAAPVDPIPSFIGTGAATISGLPRAPAPAARSSSVSGRT